MLYPYWGTTAFSTVWIFKNTFLIRRELIKLEDKLCEQEYKDYLCYERHSVKIKYIEKIHKSQSALNSTV